MTAQSALITNIQLAFLYLPWLQWERIYISQGDLDSSSSNYTPCTLPCQFQLPYHFLKPSPHFSVLESRIIQPCPLHSKVCFWIFAALAAWPVIEIALLSTPLPVSMALLFFGTTLFQCHTSHAWESISIGDQLCSCYTIPFGLPILFTSRLSLPYDLNPYPAEYSN